MHFGPSWPGRQSNVLCACVSLSPSQHLKQLFPEGKDSISSSLTHGWCKQRVTPWSREKRKWNWELEAVSKEREGSLSLLILQRTFSYIPPSQLKGHPTLGTSHPKLKPMAQEPLGAGLMRPGAQGCSTSPPVPSRTKPGREDAMEVPLQDPCLAMLTLTLASQGTCFHLRLPHISSDLIIWSPTCPHPSGAILVLK